MPAAAPPRVERPLFFLDYDGTLAPLVDDPLAAAPHPEAPALLERLAARYPVWIVTGRHLRDLDALLGLPLRAVGLHGMQEGVIGEAPRSLLPQAAAEALARCRATAPQGDGLWLEDKETAFALHYRRAADPEAARRRLEAWAAGVPEGLVPIWGKHVVELRPEGFSKGVAVARLARAHPEHTPLYLGDDVTDEDAFRALGGAAVTVKVGEGETAARYRLPDVEAVVRYLRAYL